MGRRALRAPTFGRPHLERAVAAQAGGGMRRLGARLDAADGMTLAGAALCALGLGLMWLPLAPLFVGLLLLVLGLLGSRPRVP